MIATTNQGIKRFQNKSSSGACLHSHTQSWTV